MKLPKRFIRGENEPLGEHACPACRFLTLAERPPGTYEICAICGWEDDLTQFKNPDSSGGANQASLNQSKSEFEAEILPELTRTGFNFPPRAQP